ncbi:hypothetical protein [Kineococcus sp. SYSU DK005]|uniref:hypothetical protein n=1 Tax=Kineococcus sp. SYSU DK005 TaxID=3383126 RepID=UPI003D7E9028
MSSGIPLSFEQELGVLAHGPRVLSAAPGIGIGLRCVFAHTDGLMLCVQVKATGQTARDAYQSGPHLGSGRSAHPPRPALPPSEVRLQVPASAGGSIPDAQPWPWLEHHVNHTTYGTPGASPDHPDHPDRPGTALYVQELNLWWPVLPADARLPLHAGWPEIGAPMSTTVLALHHLDRLAQEVIKLR